MRAWRAGTARGRYSARSRCLMDNAIVWQDVLLIELKGRAGESAHSAQVRL